MQTTPSHAHLLRLSFGMTPLLHWLSTCPSEGCEQSAPAAAHMLETMFHPWCSTNASTDMQAATWLPALAQATSSQHSPFKIHLWQLTP